MYKYIMVPLDGSKLAECVLPHVEALAQSNDAEVMLVRVLERLPPYLVAVISPDTAITAAAKEESIAEDYLREVAERLKKSGINAQIYVISDSPAAEALSDFAAKNKVDLVVISTHGRSGISRWAWGSVADRILHSVNVPLLIIRPSDC